MNHADRQRWSFLWRYLRGDTPWDTGIVPPEVVSWVEAAESEAVPAGRALDLGCGTGTIAIYLAQHGWEVVGVDYAWLAIWRAKRRARACNAGCRVRFYCADVSRLDFLSDDPPFDLAIDVGCLHGLSALQREGYAAHLSRLLMPGGTYLLYGFLTGGYDGIGVDAGELAQVFGPRFELVCEQRGIEATAPIPSAWFTLRRTDAP